MSATSSLEDSGERMIPECADPVTFWEHIYRYRFAARFVRHKRVLDVACGEGYGTVGLLKAGAESVIGVDISRDVCEHAWKKYGLDVRVGDASLRLPVEDASVDVIVSFETLEHLRSPSVFVGECARTLRHNGLLIISTPNGAVYRQRAASNPFHLFEMGEGDFCALLRSKFRRVQMYEQSATRIGRMARVFGAGRTSELVGRWSYHPMQPGGVLAVPAGLDEVVRRDPAAAILKRESLDGRIRNPYSVRRRVGWADSQPTFLIGVARRRDGECAGWQRACRER